MTMHRRKLNHKELDAIGKKLLAASRITESEIESVASAPGSFEGVLERIRKSEEAAPSRTAGRKAIFSFPILLGGSVSALLLAAAFAIVLQPYSGESVISSNNIPVVRPDARPDLTPQVSSVKGFTAGRANLTADTPANAPQVIEAVQREIRRPEPRVQQTRYSQSRDPQFVAVTYTGDGGESARGGRVVRVDIPRSELFAMGFNVSLENDSPTVKAELLIGPDGVTRAVRLVE